MRAIFSDTVNVRSQPSISSEIVAKYNKGESVIYDNIIENEGRLWITYIGGSGNRRYCCARDITGKILIDNSIIHFSNINSLNNANNNSNNIIHSNNNSNNNNVFPFLQKQSKYAALRMEGCLFCTACFLGGLNNINEVDECFEWAVENGKVSGKDCYVKINRLDLARQIAEKYRRGYRNYNIVKGNNHFYVVDTNGNEVYNSAGPGWGH